MSLSPSFWISPSGVIIATDADKHINMITSDPQKFGLSKEYVEEVFARYNEPMDHEGKAREEIIENILQDGWIRIRKYPRPGYYGVTINFMSAQKRRALKAWAHRMLTTGIDGEKEPDREAEVRIVDLVRDGVAARDHSVVTTISDVADGRLDETQRTMLEEIIYG